VIQLLAYLAPLAFGAAINPGMTVVALTLLLGATKPLARAVAFLTGAAATSAVAGLLGFLVTSQLGLSAPMSGHSMGESVFFLGAGLLLFIFAGWQAVRQPPAKSAHPNPRSAALLQQMQMSVARPVVALLVGAGVMLTNGKSLVLYVVALEHIAYTQLGVIASAVAASAFIVVMLLGIEIPIVLYAANRQRAVALLAHVRQWIAGHARLLMIVASMVLGIYLTGLGIVSLFT
jgi:hypothetical protein